jgi:hypothetical protein
MAHTTSIIVGPEPKAGRKIPTIIYVGQTLGSTAYAKKRAFKSKPIL